MKRDMELIRKMVLTMEEHGEGSAPEMKFDGVSEEMLGYHGYLLVDSGLANGCDVTHSGSPGPQYIVTSLTSAGHDFADSARNQYIWDEVIADMRKKGVVSGAIDVVKRALDARIRRQLGGE